SPSVCHSKLEQIPELGSQDKEREEAVGKREKRNGADGAAGGCDSPKGKGGEMETGKAAPPESKEIQVSTVQSCPAPKQGDLPRDAKAEEPKQAEGVTGNDITTPPNKELPPSPEKKPKPSASSSSSPKAAAAAKAKPSGSTTSPKRPGSAPNRKATSPTAGPAASSTTSKRPGTSTTRPSSLTPKEAKPKVTDVKALEKKTTLSKPPSSSTPKTPPRSSPAAPRTTAASPVTA
ncbi:MAP4 protein, partial [Campylorhamphus procurvoides]|nr:MAP4 protein [Campylorhamphus procurvoides]